MQINTNHEHSKNQSENQRSSKEVNENELKSMAFKESLRTLKNTSESQRNSMSFNEQHKRSDLNNAVKPNSGHLPSKILGSQKSDMHRYESLVSKRSVCIHHDSFLSRGGTRSQRMRCFKPKWAQSDTKVTFLEWYLGWRCCNAAMPSVATAVVVVAVVGTLFLVLVLVRAGIFV